MKTINLVIFSCHVIMKNYFSSMITEFNQASIFMPIIILIIDFVMRQSYCYIVLTILLTIILCNHLFINLITIIIDLKYLFVFLIILFLSNIA